MIRSIVVNDDGMCCMVSHVRLDRANDLHGNAETVGASRCGWVVCVRISDCASACVEENVVLVTLQIVVLVVDCGSV